MTVQWHRKIDSGVDRRFWGLDSDQSLRILRFCDEGLALMTAYLRKEEEYVEDWEEMDARRIRRVHGSDSGGAYESEFTDQELWQIECDDPTYRRLEDELSIINKYTQSKSIGLTGRLILGRRLNDVATKCSEIELCPALVQPILSSLPRELRDYIYDLVWRSHDMESLDWAMSRVPADIAFQDRPAEHLSDLPVPIFANPRFVGNEFATEFALRYVRALNGAEIDYRCVRAHINRDRFGSLEFPFKKFINCLTIAVGEIDGYGLDPPFAEMAWRDSLDSLLELKDNQSVKIIIYLPERVQYRKRFFEILEATRPFFRIFRENSMDVKILGYDFFNPIEHDPKNIFSEQLNCYFDGTPEEWLDMKAKEIREIPKAQQRKACKGILRAMRLNLGFYKDAILHDEATQTI